MIGILFKSQAWNGTVKGWEPIFGIFEFDLVLEHFIFIVKVKQPNLILKYQACLTISLFQYARIVRNIEKKDKEVEARKTTPGKESIVQSGVYGMRL